MRFFSSKIWLFFSGLKIGDLFQRPREKVQRLVEPRVYSHEDATKDFGYSPMTFEEGIVDEIKQYLGSKK